MDAPRYSLVIPMLNEEAVLPALFERLNIVLSQLDGPTEVLFVDDGSTDGSRDVVDRQCQTDGRYRMVSLSRNFGHQAAISAGLARARGEAVAVLDADLQDPPELVLEMAAEWRSGAMVVVARRRRRASDSWLKRTTAKWYYRVLGALSDVELEPDVGDFRLLDRRVVDVLLGMPEQHRYLRGMVPWVGFPTATVEYDRPSRHAGDTKFSARRMLAFAMDGILGFSTVPLRAIAQLGFLVSIISFLAGLGSVIAYFAGATVPGWTSTVVVVFFVGGVQLVVLGVVGGYVGRIYDEVRHRPLYVVADEVGFDDAP